MRADRATVDGFSHEAREVPRGSTPWGHRHNRVLHCALGPGFRGRCHTLVDPVSPKQVHRIDGVPCCLDSLMKVGPPTSKAEMLWPRSAQGVEEHFAPAVASEEEDSVSTSRALGRPRSGPAPRAMECCAHEASNPLAWYGLCEMTGEENRVFICRLAAFRRSSGASREGLASAS